MYVLPWIPTYSFLLVIIELSYAYQGKTRFFRVSCRVAHHSILNACWQTYLFVEMYLLLYGEDSWSVFVQPPRSHVQLWRGSLLSFQSPFVDKEGNLNEISAASNIKKMFKLHFLKWDYIHREGLKKNATISAGRDNFKISKGIFTD